MGLVVHYWQTVQRIGDTPPPGPLLDAVIDNDYQAWFYNIAPFADRAADLHGDARRDGQHVDYGVFRVFGDRGSFSAGSYGGYNAWREKLSLVVLGVEPKAVWDDFASFEGKPFAELIHFADNEGVLGPAVCTRLLRDFDEYLAVARDGDRWFRWMYESFRNACRVAAAEGAVEFG